MRRRIDFHRDEGGVFGNCEAVLWKTGAIHEFHC